MKRRKRRRGGLKLLAEMAGVEAPVQPELPPEPPKPIPVQATVIQPIDFDQVPSVFGMPIEVYDDEEDDHFCSGGFLSSLLGIGNTRNLPSTFSHKVESEGSEFRDKRAFSYTEENGKWKLVAGWTAEGVGHVPSAIKMLGSLQGLFNHLFNLMVDVDIEHQRVEKSSDPRPPGAGLLGFKERE